MTTTSIRRRLGASVLAAGLAAGFLTLASLPTASATTDVKQSRLAGTDRFGTAAAVAKAGFPTGSATVLVASGRSFPDALAGSSLGLPVLLTEKSTLPTATSQAIKSLKATKAIILGGTAAVSDAVKKQIESTGATTERVAGIDRYETAGAIAESLTASGVAKLGNKATAIVATGKDFADALAGGPLASSPTTGAYPVLLVNDTVPPATKKAIADLGIKQVVILGGSGAVSDAVETELEAETGSDAVRLAGTNRYGTATKIADAAIASFGFDAKEALLANARSFSDALAGGPLGALREAPLLLTDQVQLNAEPKSWLASHSSTVATVTALGGSAAVSDSTLTAAEKAAETPAAVRKNEKYVVTPAQRTEMGSAGTVSYTAKVGTDTVDIVLVKCDRVQTTSAGNTTFGNSNANTIADGTAKSGSDPDKTNTTAVISSVNGVPTNPTITDYVDAQKGDANGTLTFDVDGPGSTSSECVVPVVFNDADLTNSLLVPTSNPAEPTELFGTGGQAVFTPAEATASQFHVSVRVSDDDFNSFVGCTLFDESQPDPATCQPNGQANYLYDGNDTFQVTNGTALRPSNLSEFETMLTAGDDARGNYNPDPLGVSTFIIYNDKAPEAPSRSAAPPTQDKDGVHITVFDSSRSTVDSYRLFRVEKPSSGCPGTMPALSSSYVKVGDDVPDGSIDETGGQYTMTDPSPEAGKTYCYTVASVDDGDVGPGYTPPTEVMVTVAATTTTTTTTAPSGAPIIVLDGAKGKAAGPTLAKGDVHQLTFDKALNASAANSGSYKVTGTGSSSPETITCGTTATCVLSSDLKALRVSIDSASSPLVAYPLTITDLTGLGADLTNSKDKAIEAGTLTDADTTRPKITTVAFGPTPNGCTPVAGTEGSLSGFGQKCDVLNVTYQGETSLTLAVADATNVTQSELNTVLGTTMTYCTASDPLCAGKTTKVTASVSTSVSSVVITFTVLETLKTGLTNGSDVPGSNTNLVYDAALNPEAANSPAAKLP